MSWAQRSALDAALRRAPQGSGPQPVEQMRAAFAAFMGTFPIPDDVQRAPTELAGRPAVLVEPEGNAQPGTILYFHGGSFSLGSPETAMVITANLVRRTRVRAISLDYRLAPEHPFPAAIEDCVAAFRSLLDSDIDPASIVFAGDSAGGGLTVTTCLAARDAGLPKPAAIAAFSPGLDHTRSGASMITKEGIDPFFTGPAWAIPASCISAVRTRTSRCSPPLFTRTCPASRRSCSRSARTNSSSMTPYGSPSAHGRWTST